MLLLLAVGAAGQAQWLLLCDGGRGGGGVRHGIHTGWWGGTHECSLTCKGGTHGCSLACEWAVRGGGGGWLGRADARRRPLRPTNQCSICP